MSLLRNIIGGAFYFNTARATSFSQVESRPALYLPNDVSYYKHACKIIEKNRIQFKDSSLNDIYGFNITAQQKIDFFFNLHSKISQAIEVLRSNLDYPQTNSKLCKSEIEIAILKWVDHTFDSSNFINLDLFRELMFHLQKGIMPAFDELKSFFFDNESLYLFESYALLTQEWQLLEEYFTENASISAADAHKILFSVILNSYERFEKLLTYFESKLKEFELNSSDFDIFFRKMLFLLECEKKVNLRLINPQYINDVSPKKDILEVFSNVEIYNIDTELKKDLYLQLEKIMKMDERSLSNLFSIISQPESRFFVNNLVYSVPQHLINSRSTVRTEDVRDIVYLSEKYGLFSIRRVEADPMNDHSNEVVFRNFNSEFVSRTIMIFYEIDYQTDKNYYWIISEAFNSPVLKELILVKSSDFFSEFTNLKNFVTYYLYALEYLHSRQISGILPRTDDNFILLSSSIYDLPFDLRYARIGTDGLFDRVKNDYEIFVYTINSLLKKIKNEDPNEVACLIGEISERIYKNAEKYEFNFTKTDVPSTTSLQCRFVSLWALFIRFYNLIFN